MSLQATYTLPEAARRANATEEELRRAIQDGLLLARVRQNTGEFHIDAEELARYMRRTRPRDVLVAQRKRRILIVDDRDRAADVLKIELGRDARLEVKFASWGPDGELLAKNWPADLYVVAVVPPGPAGDETLDALVGARSACAGRMVVCVDRPAEELRRDPRLAAALDGLSADETLETAGGMRGLLVRAYRLLGLSTSTQALKRQA